MTQKKTVTKAPDVNPRVEAARLLAVHSGGTVPAIQSSPDAAREAYTDAVAHIVVEQPINGSALLRKLRQALHTLTSTPAEPSRKSRQGIHRGRHIFFD